MRVRMEGIPTQAVPSPTPIVSLPPLKPIRERDLTVAWALFLLLGVPFGIMASLEYLATTGIVIEALRPLWQPWPSEIVKSFLGIGCFAATLAHLAYRLGRSEGYRSGTVAGKAAARNLAEGR